MVHANKLNLIYVNFVEDWLKNGGYAAGVFRREQDLDLREKMIHEAREDAGNAWMEKRMRGM